MVKLGAHKNKGGGEGSAGAVRLKPMSLGRLGTSINILHRTASRRRRSSE
jgi:hypothetical protein